MAICWQSLEKSCGFEEFRIVLSESPGRGNGDGT